MSSVPKESSHERRRRLDEANARRQATLEEKVKRTLLEKGEVKLADSPSPAKKNREAFLPTVQSLVFGCTVVCLGILLLAFSIVVGHYVHRLLLESNLSAPVVSFNPTAPAVAAPPDPFPSIYGLNDAVVQIRNHQDVQDQQFGEFAESVDKKFHKVESNIRKGFGDVNDRLNADEQKAAATNAVVNNVVQYLDSDVEDNSPYNGYAEQQQILPNLAPPLNPGISYPIPYEGEYQEQYQQRCNDYYQQCQGQGQGQQGYGQGGGLSIGVDFGFGGGGGGERGGGDRGGFRGGRREGGYRQAPRPYYPPAPRYQRPVQSGQPFQGGGQFGRPTQVGVNNSNANNPGFPVSGGQQAPQVGIPAPPVGANPGGEFGSSSVRYSGAQSSRSGGGSRGGRR